MTNTELREFDIRFLMMIKTFKEIIRVHTLMRDSTFYTSSMNLKEDLGQLWKEFRNYNEHIGTGYTFTIEDFKEIYKKL